MGPSPQKRKASVSNAESPVKRARAVSTTLKVSHTEASRNEPHHPKVSVVQKNRQACLSGIPEELLLNIMRHLEHDPDALAKICRTDTRCNRVATEVLYEKISNTGSHCVKTQAIAQNPSLAESVRSFRWVFDKAISPAPLSSGDTRRAMRGLCFVLMNARNIRDMMIIQIRRSRFEKYEATYTPEWLGLFNTAVTQSMDECHNRFTHLKNLSIMAKPFSIEEMSSLFRLPSLEILRLVQVHQTTPFRNWTIPNSTCPIQDLDLTGAMIDVSAVTQMISSIKALRIMCYERSTCDWEPFGAAQNPLSNWPEHSWKLLGDAMRQHRSSLEKFSVFDDSDNSIVDTVYPNGRNFGVLGSFIDFQKLSAVAAPFEAFLDIAAGEHDLSSCLPAHLNEFRMRPTSIDSEDLVYLAPVVDSLMGLVCADPDPFIELKLTPDQLDKTSSLSGALTTLERAGIKVDIWVGYSCFTPADLRGRE